MFFPPVEAVVWLILALLTVSWGSLSMAFVLSIRRLRQARPLWKRGEPARRSTRHLGLGAIIASVWAAILTPLHDGMSEPTFVPAIIGYIGPAWLAAILFGGAYFFCRHHNTVATRSQ